MEIIRSIALTEIFGKPVVLYGGLLTFMAFLFTGYIAVSNIKWNNHTIPFSWHPKMAIISFIFGFVHGLFALSIFW
jgi:hypothetical protein